MSADEESVSKAGAILPKAKPSKARMNISADEEKEQTAFATVFERMLKTEEGANEYERRRGDLPKPICIFFRERFCEASCTGASKRVLELLSPEGH
ncbi:MAG: hypothetical protein N3F07_03540 [Candidatus Micrarchaeota archaeon]|nr:hypothetical protein [Candidatus Micrarchaeota archaeon]